MSVQDPPPLLGTHVALPFPPVPRQQRSPSGPARAHMCSAACPKPASLSRFQGTIPDLTLGALLLISVQARVLSSPPAFLPRAGPRAFVFGGVSDNEARGGEDLSSEFHNDLYTFNIERRWVAEGGSGAGQAPSPVDVSEDSTPRYQALLLVSVASISVGLSVCRCTARTS